MHGRDGAYETAWLDQLERKVKSQYGVPIAGLEQMVLARLAYGATVYGDDGFLGRNLLREAVGRKTPDVVVYALLESQKRLRTGQETNVVNLQHAGIFAAMADYYFRAAFTTNT